MDYGTEIAAVLKALNSENRLKTFVSLAEEESPKEIADDLDVTRSALQHYIDDFKELGLVETEGKKYEVTDFGENILNNIKRIQETVDHHQRQQKIQSMADAGLNREEIMQHLKNQGYEPGEIISAITRAASESNKLGDPEGIQEDVLSLKDTDLDSEDDDTPTPVNFEITKHSDLIEAKDLIYDGDPVKVEIDPESVDHIQATIDELRQTTNEVDGEITVDDETVIVIPDHAESGSNSEPVIEAADQLKNHGNKNK